MAVIDLCGITDIGALLRDKRRSPWAAAWIRLSGEAGDNLARRCSPLIYASRKAPPFLIVHGEEDASVPLDQATRLAGALRSAGNECRLVTLPGAGHMLGITAPVAVQRKLKHARRDFLTSLGVLQ
jgi:dipeptidyl aminopeptidase/acylaminoacyl peptidase